MSVSFQEMLDQIRTVSDSEREKGSRFERVMKKFFAEDPVYKERFSNVWLWPEWAARNRDFDGKDTGIDLVAKEREGGYCAIQCKCYAPDTRISKPHLDSFISASARDPFTARIVVDTGHEWGPTAKKTIEGLKPKCDVRYLDDLISRSFDWPDLTREEPEELRYRSETFRLRPHQREAFDDVIAGFRKHDRGKLIMACGTGKTFTALRIAETVAGVGGRVLYLVPSISLFAQSMREWATQRDIRHRYVGICSDTRAGRKDEDASLEELEIPVTTEPSKISNALRIAGESVMTVVFCTYHSLPLVEAAQKEGAPPFDLILCDEAHRTTGIERPEDEKTSPFVLVHDGERIRAEKRLYMTATPRLFTESAKEKAARHEVEVFSMDDPETYGPEFHRLPFSRAVDQDLLSDYKVVVLGVYEQQADMILNRHSASRNSEVTITDAAKIVGCWRALQNPENKDKDEGPLHPLKRAIAFTNTIQSSKRLEAHWDDIITQASEMLTEIDRAGTLQCETRHVDGQHNALDRKARIDWLKGDSAEEDGACRILSNARCLSEGIDVPALDAVLFMSPRNSHVDIVQAVGRAMRKAKGKEYGYIILPIAVPAGVEPERALDRNDQFEVVWSVLRALRSHDDRLDAEINKIDLNKALPDGIVMFDGKDEKIDASELPFPPVELPPGAMFAKIVEKCGDRKYWQSWAKDVADIFDRLVARIGNLLESPENETLREWFGDFHEELKVSINEFITRESAVHMMAQHILTRPVFEALFEGYDFASGNPVSQALDKLRADFGEFGLENEIRDMAPFYESVRMRARGLDNSEARQRVLMELYENFFATAMKKDADRLGIVYTPPEVVDFILHSADHVLREEFGRSLSDEGVHVLDPFTGTGIFLVRLIQSALIHDADLLRKYREELHANEIILLAYYIAAVHIEEAFHGRLGPETEYEPFEGIVLTDTFNLHTEKTGFPKTWLPDNSARVERQQRSPIQVIVGNPPWSAGQRSSADENPNVDYPELERRVAETYAVRSKATLKNSLYDYYKMAIRWASDRIGEQGVVAFVTNGSWIDGNVDSGVRACLGEEFNTVYVLNLRGNARTSGELRRSEGDNVFNQGSRAPVAITILVRNADATHEGCRILYRDIGDYLKREEKLSILDEAGSVAGIEDWREIKPDEHHDWIGQRDAAFQDFRALGSKDAKAGRADDAIFCLYSRGLATSRDAYLYNFSNDACEENGRAVVSDYMGALGEWNQGGHLVSDLNKILERHSSSVRWDAQLKDNLRRRKKATFSVSNVWTTQYRPYVKQYCYVDYILVNRKYQQDSIFPADKSENRAICVPGVGSTKPFSALVVDTMPDLEMISKGQCFPRYRYQERAYAQDDLPGLAQKLEQVDNITDTALRTFRVYYKDNTITKDMIFDYVYGVLHAQDYRQRFANDLSKELPRVPLATDFHAFVEAGLALSRLHLGYETCAEYPLEEVFTGTGEPRLEHYRLGTRAMRYADKEEKTTLVVNDLIRMEGIPAEAHQYVVNGRTPLEWFIDRYRITTDKQSGIVNDANGWFDDPRDLIAAIRRIVHLSVETVRIVNGLPNSFGESEIIGGKSSL